MTPTSLIHRQPSVHVFLYACLLLIFSGISVTAQELFFWDNYAGLAGGLGKNDGPGAQARFFSPAKVDVDAAGNVYVADTGNHTIRKITPGGVVSTYAGKAGEAGSADGSRANARFNSPYSLAVHGSGDIYVADTENHTIRRITASGTVTTIGGIAGMPGDLSGSSTSSRFHSPTDIAVSADRTVYVTEPANKKVKKINAQGLVSIHYTANNFLSQQLDDSYVYLKNSAGLALNKSGNTLAIADTMNHVVYRLTNSLFTYGSPRFAGTADGNESFVRFNYPYGVTFSGTDIYVADSGNNTVRKITAAGITSTIAGQAGVSGFLDGQGTSARFKSLGRIAADSGGNLYVTDEHKIRKISNTGEVSTIAGEASNEGSTDGIGTVARFSAPNALAQDVSGNIYVADEGNHTIRKISPSGEVSTFAGEPGVSGYIDGSTSQARFASPSGVAIDSVGNLYVADTYNHIIRKINTGGIVSILAGYPGEAGATNGTGGDARFSHPVSLTVDSANNLYVADSGNYCIRRVSPTGTVTTYAGGLGIFGRANGIGTNARFSSITGIAMDAANNMYVVDASLHTVRKITTDRNVTTLAGAFTYEGFGSSDGTGLAARFRSPRGINVDKQTGTIYVSDTGNHTIRQITPAGVVKTIAGLARDYGSTSGSGKKARFTSPTGLLVGGDGTIFVSDTGNNRIVRAIPMIAPTVGDAPSALLVAAGEDVEVSITATGTPPPNLQWLKNGKPVSGKTTNTLTLDDVTLANAGAYTLRASNEAGTKVSAPFRLAIVSQTPLDIGIKEGGTIVLKVDAVGTDLTYSWIKDGTPLNSSLDSRISGENSAKLTIKGATDADQGTYICQVSLNANPAINGGARNVTIARRPIVNPFTPGNWSVSQDTGALVITAQNGGSKFTATGLPPGVKINPLTGELSGRPTQPRMVKGQVVPYKIKIVVTNPGGVSEPYFYDWLVEPLAPKVVGNFNGLINHNTALNGAPGAEEGYGGSIRLVTTSKGTVSGQLKLGAATYSFKGLLDVTGVGSNAELSVEIKRKSPLPSLLLTLTLQAASGDIAGNVSDGTNTTLTNGVKSEPDTQSAGTYNIALTTTASAPYPTGNGYVILKLSSKGAATLSGRLADGTTITGSTTRGTGGNIPWHQMLYQKTGSVQGWLEIEEAAVSGTFQWMKNPASTPKGNYRDGFSLHPLTLDGGLYTKPTAGAPVMGLPAQLIARFENGALVSSYEEEVELNAKNQLISPVSTLRIKLVPNTGLVSGTFPLPLAEGETKPRTATYTGLLIPTQNQATGYFLAPETSTKNAPTISGRMLLFAD